MQFPEFNNQLLIKIKRKDKTVTNFIDNNEKLVKEYFSESSLNYVKNFIEELYLSILNEHKKFKVIESVLKHPFMTVVLAEFRKSNILIKICEEGSNKKAIEWLLSMKIDINVQDENGKTALMATVRHWNLESIVDNFLNIKECNYNLSDKEGNTALFYSSSITLIFKKLLNSNLFDYTHLNSNHENILLYCAKNDTLKFFNELINKPDIDANIINNDGKNLAMILVENTRYNELKTLIQKRNINVNYKNKFGETLVSTFIKNYHKQVEGETDKNYITEYNYYKVKNYALILKTLIESGCDFNCTIDGDGNTPVTFYMIMEDYVSLQYLLDHCDIDLTIKNKYGIDAIYLSLFMKESIFDSLNYKKQANLNTFSYKSLRTSFHSNKTFDYNFLDSNHNNLVIHGIIHNYPFIDNYIDHISPKILFERNNKNENVIIIATKLGHIEALARVLLSITDDKEKYEHVNAQDHIGNTALHYAVLLKDKYIISILMKNKADPYLKNNGGISAINLAKNSDDSDIFDLLKNPISFSEVKKQMDKDKLKTIMKSKSTDEKINDYIINYRMSTYQKDYEDLCINEVISYYTPSPNNITVQQWMMEVLFPNIGGEIYVFHAVAASPSTIIKSFKSTKVSSITKS